MFAVNINQKINFYICLAAGVCFSVPSTTSRLSHSLGEAKRSANW